jgi:hypothetical protein
MFRFLTMEVSTKSRTFFCLNLHSKEAKNLKFLFVFSITYIV